MQGPHPSPSRHTHAFMRFGAAVALAVAATLLLLDPVEVVRSADALPQLSETLGEWWPEIPGP